MTQWKHGNGQTQRAMAAGSSRVGICPSRDSQCPAAQMTFIEAAFLPHALRSEKDHFLFGNEDQGNGRRTSGQLDRKRTADRGKWQSGGRPALVKQQESKGMKECLKRPELVVRGRSRAGNSLWAACPHVLLP